MNAEQAMLLKERFAESDTEWRRLARADELDAFLAEARVPRDAGGEASPIHLDEEGLGFTLADAILAETGSVVLTGRFPGSRRTAFLAETHYALVAEEEVHPTLGDFLTRRGPGGSAELAEPARRRVTLIRGPSRTADIEKVLVLGAHGPRSLVVATAPAALLDARFAEAPLAGAPPPGDES